MYHQSDHTLPRTVMSLHLFTVTRTELLHSELQVDSKSIGKLWYDLFGMKGLLIPSSSGITRRRWDRGSGKGCRDSRRKRLLLWRGHWTSWGSITTPHFTQRMTNPLSSTNCWIIPWQTLEPSASVSCPLLRSLFCEERNSLVLTSHSQEVPVSYLIMKFSCNEKTTFSLYLVFLFECWWIN